MSVLSHLYLFAAALWFCLYEITLSQIIVTNQQLGMTFQQPLANDGFYIWTTRLQFEYDVQTKFTDDELVSLADTAYNFVSSSWSDVKRLGFSFTARPRAVTLLAQGNKIYLASSLKPTGQGTFYYKGLLPRVLGTTLGYSLIRCQHFNGPTHRAGGHCGEVFLAHMLLKNNPPMDAQESINLVKNSKIVTIAGTPTGNIIVPPCAAIPPVKGIGRGGLLDPEQEKWGCSRVISELGLVAISPTVVAASTVVFESPLPTYLHFCFDNVSPSPQGK